MCCIVCTDARTQRSGTGSSCGSREARCSGCVHSIRQIQGMECACFPGGVNLAGCHRPFLHRHSCGMTCWTTAFQIHGMRPVGVRWQVGQCRRQRLAATAVSRPQGASGRRWSRRQPACPSWGPTAAPRPSRPSRRWPMARQAALAPRPRSAIDLSPRNEASDSARAEQHDGRFCPAGYQWLLCS